jgi:hypothetical protein
VVLISLSFYQAGPLLDGTQFGLRFGQMKTRALDSSFFCRAGVLDDVAVLIAHTAAFQATLISRPGAVIDFSPTVDLVAPVVQPFLQPVQCAADFYFGGVEDFLRLRVEASQMSLELFQRLDRQDVSRRHRPSLTLLQVLLDPLGFAQQEGDMLIGGAHKVRQHAHRLLKLLGELLVFLVAPGIAQADELGLQA